MACYCRGGPTCCKVVAANARMAEAYTKLLRDTQGPMLAEFERLLGQLPSCPSEGMPCS